jgi:hypothetical protein
MATKRKKPIAPSVQLVVGFVIPTIILLFLSDESKLGPFWSMTWALAFPVALELFSFATGRKASLISLFSIVGILLIGVISLLGLDEQWLGVRRAAIYVVGALMIAFVLRFKHAWIDRALGAVLDMPAIRAAAQRRSSVEEVNRLLNHRMWLFAVLLLIIGIWSYLLTLIIMTAPTGSSEFNTEYAQLRLLSLPLVSLPFLVGMVALLVSVMGRLEKLTGIESDQLLKKKK